MVDKLLNDDELRFIFVGGKGGVGKTTSSSALSSQLSKNKRVLLVSTDPAHSLSDAFRTKFGPEPIKIEFDKFVEDKNLIKDMKGSLHVMEIDPAATMKDELGNWAELAKDLAASGDNLSDKIAGLQEWLSGIPGIDEATALSQSVRHIESGEYDIIVFDTAPTGHTLKLLQLPAILDLGLQKLESWQSTIWGYWEAFKSTATLQEDKANAAKAQIAEKLKEYKKGIQKVNKMLTDQMRTQFVVICIAEYLSISESQRLLFELEKCKVTCKHVVVNQLVAEGCFLESDELESLLKSGIPGLSDKALAQKITSACQLTSSRRAIQSKYLKMLKECDEVTKSEIKIVELPLLPSEVTGPSAILSFSELMRGDKTAASFFQKANKGGALYDDETLEKEEAGKNLKPEVGAEVEIHDLQKSAEYNGLRGKIIVDGNNVPSGRYGIKFDYNGNEKTIQILPKNFTVISSPNAKRQKKEDNKPVITEEKVNKAKALLEDPEIKAMIKKIGPRAETAVEQLTTNPMLVMQYMADPELQPLVQLAMGKFMGGGGASGA